MKKAILSAAIGAAILGAASAASAATLADVKSKGFVTCGVSSGIPGFSNPDDKGEWSGIDVDYCRAIASAVFGDATKAKFVPSHPRTVSLRFSLAKSTSSHVTRHGQSAATHRSASTSAPSITMTARASS